MDHKELHNFLSQDFKDLRSGKLSPQKAREIFNGAGKIINNCKNELQAIAMGLNCDVPLLGIKQVEVKKNRKQIDKYKNKGLSE